MCVCVCVRACARAPACVCVCAKCDPFLPDALISSSNFPNFFSHTKIPIRCLWTAFCVPLSYIFFTKNNTLNGVCMLNVTAAHWNNICYWGDSAIVSLSHLSQWAYSVQLANLTHGVHWVEQQQAGRGEGVEWRGREWSGGQGRVPDCLGGLSRVGISSRSTRPWNGQPPS